LSAAGFVAADEEAVELTACAAGDEALLAALVERRLAGEPLAWITGTTSFCGLSVRVDPGVYVPRWQSEPLARRGVERLPDRGVAVDLCTGAGALAMALGAGRPDARVVGCDLDDRSVRCARSNGADVYQGDLFAPLPRELIGAVDLVIGVVPYVPTSALPLLPTDTLEFESTLAYDGGADGTDMLRRAVAGSVEYLRAGGALLLELGGEQVDALRDEMKDLGYLDLEVLTDADGDVRGLEATLGGRS